jgi:hypothetical protein
MDESIRKRVIPAEEQSNAREISLANLLKQECREDTSGFQMNGNAAPVGHALLREAWALRPLGPRGSAVLGAAAAEKGVEQRIGAVAPDAGWLTGCLVTPHHVEMPNDCLPGLRTRNSFAASPQPPSDSITKHVQSAGKARNKMVRFESGNEILSKLLSSATVEDVILSSRGRLSILDHYEGDVRPERRSGTKPRSSGSTRFPTTSLRWVDPRNERSVPGLVRQDGDRCHS